MSTILTLRAASVRIALGLAAIALAVLASGTVAEAPRDPVTPESLIASECTASFHVLLPGIDPESISRRVMAMSGPGWVDDARTIFAGTPVDAAKALDGTVVASAASEAWLMVTEDGAQVARQLRSVAVVNGVHVWAMGNSVRAAACP